MTISISATINQQYANRKLSTKSITKSPLDYYITFSKVSWYGFPFKVGFQVNNWQEEGEDVVIALQSPIKLGYDLLKQAAFVEYSGTAISQYKKTIEHYEPIKTEFGTIFNTKNYSFTIKMPFSIKLLKVLVGQKNPFEIINFIKKITLSSKQTQIFDLYDQHKLYDEDYTSLSLSFEKRKYYTDLADFQNNVPYKLNINYTTNIIDSNIINRKIPSGILLYIFTGPFACNIEGQLYIQANSPLFNELTKDYELKIISAKTASKLHDAYTTLLYRDKTAEGDRNIQLKIDSKIDLKAGFSEEIIQLIQYLISLPQLSHNNEPWLEELRHIINNKDKFSLTELENHQYLFSLDMNSITKAYNTVHAQINNLSLFSNNTGFRITTEGKKDKLQEFNIKGLLILNNYRKPIELISNYILNLGRFKSFSEKSRIIYKDTLTTFLKQISDYPASTSDDLSFEYTLESNNITKGKIGSIEISKILPLYYLTLYTKAADYVRPNDLLEKRIQELIPDFHNHPGSLQQLIFPSLPERDKTN